MKKFVLPKDYPELDFGLMDITLVEAAGQLLSGMSENAAQKSKKYLEDLGITVRVNCKVVDFDSSVIKLENGENFNTKILIWAAGIKGQMPQGINQDMIVRGNRIKVNQYNRVEGCENIFAIGDIAFMKTEAYPFGHPQVAQVALQQAALLATNLQAVRDSKELKAFRYADKGSMATVGRNRAVVDLHLLKFGGFMAWLIWMFIHLMAIVGVKNRLLIFINWFWNYMTYDQSLRLIIRPALRIGKGIKTEVKEKEPIM